MRMCIRDAFDSLDLSIRGHCQIGNARSYGSLSDRSIIEESSRSGFLTIRKIV